MPALIVIGVTGAGKSTLLEWLEQAYRCRRVRRFTTRPQRAGDDSRLVVCVTAISAGPDDFVYAGWGQDSYCIRRTDVDDVWRESNIPLIELGAPQDAFRCQMRFAPARIVWVRRNTDIASLQELLRKRKVTGYQFEERLESLLDDLSELVAFVSAYDAVVENDGNLEALQRKWSAVGNRFGFVPRCD